MAFRLNGPLQLKQVFDLQPEMFHYNSFNVDISTCCQSCASAISIHTLLLSLVHERCAVKAAGLDLSNNEPCLKKIWSECVKSTYTEVKFLPENRHNILDLVHDPGYEGSNERDVLDLPEADREHIAVSKELTSKFIENFFLFQQELDILLENEPGVERSASFSRNYFSH
ncbi:hypothetical protein HHI36_008986 [Cryptolaemus montrouzieri]|uniref:Uncharacterized protein n=1 Tax=Cryptolaemus montrouzieri TaxID=559131 RepID=A0ABD2MUQ7_9CUCU